MLLSDISYLIFCTGEKMYIDQCCWKECQADYVPEPPIALYIFILGGEVTANGHNVQRMRVSSISIAYLHDRTS